ncbi:MAG: rhomboid family intramembrane serine protease [Bacteroidetes bacterium]|nr:MAG: rhomboid family intramembrane serine protease [Bacteroidota bacterium]
MDGFMQDLRNAFGRNGRAHIQLIILNVLVFLGLNVLIVTLSLFDLKGIASLVASQFELPADASKLLYRPWTVLTYAFWHADIFHIFFNMLALYWFGQIFEEYVGKKRLWSVYILSALAGAFAFLLLMNFAPVSMWRNGIATKLLLGASGAVYGVVLATATLLPTYTFFLFLIGPVQIRYIAAVYVILSYIGLGGMNAGGNMAHLGGAFMGYLFTVQLQRGNDLGLWMHDFAAWVGKLFRPKPKMRTTYKAKEKATVNQTKTKASAQANSQNQNAPDSPNQDEIDAILDKISANGYDSLTKEEKQKLFKASNS